MVIHVDAVHFALHSESYEEAAVDEPVIICRDGVAQHVLVSMTLVEAIRARRAEGAKDRAVPLPKELALRRPCEG